MRIIIIGILLSLTSLSLVGQNCTGSLTVSMIGSSTGDSLNVNATQVDIYCTESTDGSIDLTVTGGNPQYMYNWSQTNNGNEDQFMMGPGTYVVTVVDQENCLKTKTIEIVILDPTIDDLELVTSSSCGMCTLTDGNGTYFYNNNDYIAYIEDINDFGDLGVTTVCADILQSVGFCGENPYLQRVWTIEADPSNAELTLFFTDEEFQNLIDASEYNSIQECLSDVGLCITSYDGGAETCQDYNTFDFYSLADGDLVITQNDPQPGIWSVTLQVGSFSTFYVHTCSDQSALPLDLMSFYGEAFEEYNKLNWVTENEYQVDQFILERSVDGKRFQLIGSLDAKGGNGIPCTYQYIDMAPLRGKNYYRLKIIDNDGSFQYSHTIVLDRFSALAFEIYPNPFSQRLIISTNGDEFFKGSVQVFDKSGRNVYYSEIQYDKGTEQNVIELSHLIDGLYTLFLIDERGKIVLNKKMLKIK